MSLFSNYALASDTKELDVTNCYYQDTKVGDRPQSPGRYINQGCINGVVEYPSAEKKSLLIQTQKDATQWFLDISLKNPDAKKAVVEAMFAYDGSICSQKRIFTMSGVVWFTMDKKGTVSLYDGTVIFDMVPEVFYKLSIIHDFENRTFSVKLNDKTVILNRAMPEKAEESVGIPRIQIHTITGDDEYFYLRYYRMYEGTELKTDAEVTPDASQLGDNSVYEKPEDIEITNELIEERMRGNMMFYTRSPKVRIADKIVMMDESNADVMPQYVGGSLMVPGQFLGTALGAEVADNANSITCTLNSKSVTVSEGSLQYTLNGESRTLTDAPTVLHGHLYVPLRAVCEGLGKEVKWDSCGIVLAGDTAESFDWTDKTDFKILLNQMREVVYYMSVTPDEVMAKLKEKNPDNAHPRLLVTRDKLEILRERVKSEEPYKTWMEGVIKNAETFLPQTNEELKLHYVLEDGIRLLSVSRRAQKYITNLSFAYLMTQNEKYARKAIDIMLFLGSDTFPDWHPHHFLDVSEMAAGVALGYDWCYSAMTDDEKTKIAHTLRDYALKPVMEDYNEVEGRSRTWLWSSKSSSAYPQNWISICFGGTTLAALAVGDEDLGDFTEAGNVITEGMERMKDWLEKYMPDGVCTDGGLYWLLAMNYNAFGMNGMETALGTDYTISNSPGFCSSFDWLAQLMGHDGAFNVSQGPAAYIQCADSPEFHWWSQKTGNPAYSQFRLQKSIDEWGCTPIYKDIIWYEKSGQEETLNLPNDYINRNNQAFVSMMAGQEKLDTWFGMFTGSFAKEGSSSDEEGTFALDMLGTRWASILGTEGRVYSSDSTPRADFYRYRAEGANTVVIQPGYSRFYNPYVYGKEERRESNATSSIVIYDFTDTIAFKGAKTWRRGAYLDRENQSIIVQDEMTAEKPVEFYWFMHTSASIDIAEDGKSAILSKNNKRVLVSLKSRLDDMTFEVMEAQPLPTSPNPNQTSNAAFKKLAIHIPKTRNAELAVEFIPLFSEGTDITPKPFGKMADWKLKDTTETDSSLLLSDLKVNGKTMKGFTPDDKYYRYFTVSLGAGNNKKVPVISAASDVGNVRVIQADENNLVSKIIVSDFANPSMRNEYYIAFETYNFSKAGLTDNTPPVIATGEMPEGFEKLEIQSVKAENVYDEKEPVSNLTDGNTETTYANNVLGSYVEFDLGSVKNINSFGAAVSKRREVYLVATSEDGESWDTVAEVISAEGENGEMRYYDIPETTARYVRVYCCGCVQAGVIDGVVFRMHEFALYRRNNS